MDPYRELGLSPEAASEPELVRAAFKALAKKYHPDGQSDPRAKAQAEEKMARLNEAQRLILSGEYRPPSPSTALVTAVEQPDRPVETPKPVRPSAPPRQRRVPIAPMAAAAGCLLFALLSPSFFQKRHLERARQLETSGQYQQALDEVNESIKSDSRNGEAVMGLLDELHTAGSTICMVTHDPRAASYADRVLVLADGKIVNELIDPSADDVVDFMKTFGD